ncbi:MAG: DNA recombination protein RmuC [Actinomycetales bacterium]|nr:DNA recombination protein RmuC [Actinomycetales bacterium]
MDTPPMETSSLTLLALSLVLGLTLGAGLGLLGGMGMGRSRERVRTATLEGQLALVTAERDTLRQGAADTAALDGLVGPLRESLDQLRRSAEQANLQRTAAESALRTHMEQVQSRYDSLESATRQIAGALAKGQTRGQWGEMQLEQLLDHAGLIEGTHYRRQDTKLHSGNQLRPDVVIRMPGGGEILIDAKFPFDAYWTAAGADDPVQRDQALRKHAADLLSRAKELSAKGYSESPSSPDFVVMFLPLESLLSAALDVDGLLLEQAFDRRVIPATPTTMLALLRTVGFAYERKLMADNAEEIRQVGAEMLNRLAVLVEHLEGLRRGLAQAVTGYNDFVGSFERNALTQARRMRALGVASQRSLEPPAEVDLTPRAVAGSR